MQHLLSQSSSPYCVGERRVHSVLLCSGVSSWNAFCAASSHLPPLAFGHHHDVSWSVRSFTRDLTGYTQYGVPFSTLKALKAFNARAYNTTSHQNDPLELNKRSQVTKRLDRTSSYFKRLGGVGFWGQLVCTVVSAVILAFSVAISGKPTSQVTFYFTAGGIAAAFLSVFWSFGYIRLSHRLRATLDNLAKAPPRAEVVKNLRNGIIINLFGMGSTLLGMQATVGFLVAKALTTSAGPYFQGAPSSYSPVLALDVFLVQASANTLLSHFLGILISLELLRSVTLPQPPPENVIPKLA